jgi:hypothetical protein
LTVHIHGIDFTVEFAETRLATQNMGETSWDKCEIVLQQDMPPQRQQQVFWHEVVHCLLDGEDDEPEIDEAFIRRLGNSLWTVLNDNSLLAPQWWDRVTDQFPQPISLPARKAKA